MPTDEKKPRSFLWSMVSGMVCAGVAGGACYLNFPDVLGVVVLFSMIGFFAGAWFGPKAIGALITVL